MDKIFDRYNLQARVYPSFLLFFPFLIVLLVLNPSFSTSTFQNNVISLCISCGFFFLLTTLSRSAGKKIEKKLLKKWGGWLTTIWLRHSDNNLSNVTKERYYEFFNQNIPNIKMPTQQEEQENPKAADSVYQSAIDWLKEQRRDSIKYPLVQKEVTEYGFRRNLAGLRNIAFMVYIIVFTLSAIIFYFRYIKGANIIDINSFFNVLVNSFFKEPYKFLSCLILFFSALFTFRFSDDWVKESAEQYTKALLNSIDS